MQKRIGSPESGQKEDIWINIKNCCFLNNSVNQAANKASRYTMNMFRATNNKYRNWKDLKIHEWLNIDLYIHWFKPQLDVQNQKIILIKIQQIFCPLLNLFLVMIHENSWTWNINERTNFKALAIWFNCVRPICFKDQGTLRPNGSWALPNYQSYTTWSISNITY